MLTRLERDRAVGQVVSLQATLKSLHGGIGGGIPTGPPTRAASRLDGNLSGVKEVLIDGSQPLKKCKCNVAYYFMLISSIRAFTAEF